MSIILSGLEMAKNIGVACTVINVKKNPAYSGRRSYYLRVDVDSKSLSGKYSTVIFSAFVDGIIEVDALYKDGDALSYEHQGDIVYCNSAIDIRNAIYWLWNECGNSAAYDRCRKETDLLLSESRRRAEKKGIYPDLVLPHTKFDNKLSAHIKDLEQIRRYLRQKFIGTYIFDWIVKDNSAVLSVCKYCKDTTGLSDRLLELQIVLYQADGNNLVRISAMMIQVVMMVAAAVTAVAMMVMVAVRTMFRAAITRH